MNRIHLVAAIACGAIASLAGSAARADSLKAGDERFKFMAGWFLPAFNTDGSRVIWTSQRGPKIDGEMKPSSQLWIADWKGDPFAK